MLTHWIMTLFITQCFRSTSSSASHFLVKKGRFLLMISPAKNVVSVGYSYREQQSGMSNAFPWSDTHFWHSHTNYSPKRNVKIIKPNESNQTILPCLMTFWCFNSVSYLNLSIALKLVKSNLFSLISSKCPFKITNSVSDLVV